MTLFTFPNSITIDLTQVSIIGPLYVAGERWVVASIIPAKDEVWEEESFLWYAPWKKVTIKHKYRTRESREHRRAPEFDEYQFKFWMRDGHEGQYPDKVQSVRNVVSYDVVTEPQYWSDYDTPSVEAHRREPVEAVRAALIEAWRAAKANAREPSDPQKS